MSDRDRSRNIVERDIYRRMNQLGGTLYLYSIQGVEPYEDLVHAVHNELTDEDIENGAEVMQWWLVSDHLGERLRDTGFLVMETVDGWFYGRTTAGQALEQDIDTMLRREHENTKDCTYPDRYADGPHEDPLLADEGVTPDEC